jgi:hypothetical protein
VGILVVLLMRVGVYVFLLPVCVQMAVMFGEVQPDAARPERSRSEELPSNGIAVNQDR